MTGKRNLIELRTKVLCALVKTALKNKATAPYVGSSADYLTYLHPTGESISPERIGLSKTYTDQQEIN